MWTAARVAVLGLLLAVPASAGMPAPLPLPPPDTTTRLTDVTVERLQVISFFLAALLAAAAAVWGLWRVLRRDLPRLPRLSFGGALAAVLLWGLVSVVVLTMISGARELMTPGAWKRAGPTYTLAGPPADNPEGERMQGLMALRDALCGFAARQGGRYPDAAEAAQLPDHLWRVPGSGSRYEYTPGRTARGHGPAELLACEPYTGTGPRLELYTDGQIVATRPRPKANREEKP